MKLRMRIHIFTAKLYELSLYLNSRDEREPDKTRKRLALSESIRFVLTFFGSFFVSRQKMNVKSHNSLLLRVVAELNESKRYVCD